MISRKQVQEWREQFALRHLKPEVSAEILTEILEALEIDNGSRCDRCKSTDIKPTALYLHRCGECGKLCN